MPKSRVKERRRRAQEFKRLVQVHGGRKKRSEPAPPDEQCATIAANAAVEEPSN
jgi:hypothetical protein